MENKGGAQFNILHVRIHLVASQSPVFFLPFNIFEHIILWMSELTYIRREAINNLSQKITKNRISFAYINE
jgi:hypothetical protein